MPFVRCAFGNVLSIKLFCHLIIICILDLVKFLIKISLSPDPDRARSWLALSFVVIYLIV